MSDLEPHILIPSARRLVTSLRDMGYDFAQAVADVVDNSIEAKASLIAIDLEFDGDDSWVRIADNGRGMTREQLREALRYGAEREYDAQALGKFGLGLKTASMSQCQRLTVASRWNRERADIGAYAWDLDHISKTNRWEIIPLERKELRYSVSGPLIDHPGTVVFWERLDRILGYKHPYGEAARRRMLQMCRELETHLAMVFHRFLNGDAPGRKVTITVNGNKLAPWDPFCREERATKVLEETRIEVEHEGTLGEVTFRGFVLPNQADFSTPEAFRAASGPNNWNQQQGFYIYRANRMIQSGGWSNLRAPDEHTKLARIAVDFSPALDEAFKINVAKMRVQLPGGIREEVRVLTAVVARLARQVYDKKEGRQHSTPSASENKVKATALGSKDSGIRSEEPAPNIRIEGQILLPFSEWLDLLLSVAGPIERSVISQVASRVGPGVGGA